MPRVFVVSSDDEEDCDLTSSVSSVTLSGPLLDTILISSHLVVSDSGEPSMDTNTQPTCIPPIYDSHNIDPSKDRQKFYNIYIGELVGCYREWYVTTVVPYQSVFIEAIITGVTLADESQVFREIFTTAIQPGSLHWKDGSSTAVRSIVMDRILFMALPSNPSHLLAFQSLCPLDVPGTT